MQVFIAKKSLVCFEASGSIYVGLLEYPVMCYGDPTSTVPITCSIQARWMLVGQVKTLVLNLGSCRVGQQNCFKFWGLEYASLDRVAFLSNWILIIIRLQIFRVF